MTQQTPEPTDGKPAAQQQTPAPSGDQAKQDEPLGDGGKKALEAEREARKTAEKDLAAMRSEFDAFKTGLAGALGVKPGGSTSPEEAVAQMQQRLDAMQTDSEVYRLAAQHQITEQADIDLLRSATDAEARGKLAERLAAKGSETPGTPKPDATQGGKGGTGSGTPEQDFAAFLGRQLAG